MNFLDCDIITDIRKIDDETEFLEHVTLEHFIDFLHNNLGEFGDTKKDIHRAIRYAFSDAEGKGGFVLVARDEDELIGGAVVIDTGMKGYIPEHILVYITTQKDQRGKGIGTKILKRIFQECDGNIALHVEYDNPALRLYKRVGFTSKYAEMRYNQKEA